MNVGSPPRKSLVPLGLHASRRMRRRNILPALKVSEAHRWTLILGLVMILGNPGVAMFGQNARHATIGLGCLLVGVVIIVEILGSYEKLKIAIMCLGGAAFIESWQFIRSQEVFAFTLIAFRGICYLLFIGGCVVSLPGQSKPFLPLTDVVWKYIVVGACGLFGICYGLAVRNANMLVSSAARLTADESLHPVGIAYSFGVLTVICVICAVTSQKWGAGIFAMISSVGPIYSLLSAGSRGGAVSAVAAVLIVGLVANRRNARKLVKVAVLFFVIAGLIVWLGSVGGLNQLDLLIERMRSGISGWDASMLQRAYIRDHYYQLFDKWFLLGLAGYANQYPHNIFLELVIRFGILGVAFVALVLIGVAKIVKELFSRNSETIAISCGVLLFALINSQTNGSLEYNRALFFGLGMSAGLILGGRPRIKRRRSYIPKIEFSGAVQSNCPSVPDSIRLFRGR